MRLLAIAATAAFLAGCGDLTDTPVEARLHAEQLEPLVVAVADARDRVLPAIRGVSQSGSGAVEAGLSALEAATEARLASELDAAAAALLLALDRAEPGDPATAADRAALRLVAGLAHRITAAPGWPAPTIPEEL